MGPAKAVDDRARARIGGDGLLDHGHGLGQVLAPVDPGVAQVVQQFRLVRPHRQRPGQVGLGLLPAAGALIGAAAGVVDLPVRRLAVGDQAVPDLDGLGIGLVRGQKVGERQAPVEVAGGRGDPGQFQRLRLVTGALVAPGQLRLRRRELVRSGFRPQVGRAGPLHVALLLQDIAQHDPPIVALGVQPQRQAQVGQADLVLLGADQRGRGRQKREGRAFLDRWRGGRGLAGRRPGAGRPERLVRRIALQGRVVERHRLRPPAPAFKEGAVGGDRDLGRCLAGGDRLEIGLGLVVPLGPLEQVRLADLTEIVDAGVAAQGGPDHRAVEIADRGGHPWRQQRHRTPMREADSVVAEDLLGDLALVVGQRLHGLDQSAHPLALVRGRRAIGRQQRRLLDVAGHQGRGKGALRHGGIVAALRAGQFEELRGVAVAALSQRRAAGQEQPVGAIGRRGRDGVCGFRWNRGAGGQQDERSAGGGEQETTHGFKLGGAGPPPQAPRRHMFG